VQDFHHGFIGMTSYAAARIRGNTVGYKHHKRGKKKGEKYQSVYHKTSL
jgi:hypothetical protein